MAMGYDNYISAQELAKTFTIGSMSTPAGVSSGGGGVRDLGTVTAGMAMMNFDHKTKPYTREDFIDFLLNYKDNLNETELRLVEKGMGGTFIGMPLFFTMGYLASGRLGWHRVVRAMVPLSDGKPNKWVARIPTIGRIFFGVALSTIPYMVVQQWFVTRVLALDEHESNLSLHVRRLMLAQRSSMMFTRTSTREVTREEQQQLLREAEVHANENRSGRRGGSSVSASAADVNLRLGQQVLTPVAQTGYKSMPGQ